MKKKFILLFGLILIIFLSGCAVSLAADVTPPPDYQAPVEQEPILMETTAPILPPDISNGKSIFIEKCAPCHGENGMGDGVQSSQLPVPAAPIGNFEFAKDKKPIDWFEIITNGNIENFMPGFQSLNDRERWNVTAYAFTLSEKSAEIEILPVYKENCESCHALGNSAGITDFSDFGQLIDQSKADIIGIIQNGNVNGMPAFQNLIPENDIDHLAEYVWNLGFSNREIGQSSNPQVESTPAITLAEPGTTNANLTLFTIKGRVNGLDKLPDELIVTLKVYDTMNLISQVDEKTDSNGSFAFKDVALENGQVYQLITIVDGIEYSSDVLHNPEIDSKGEVDLPINITTTTTDNSNLFAERLHVFFDFIDENTIQIVELFVINNPTNQVVISESNLKPIIQYKLPEEAQNLQFEQGEIGARYIETDEGFGDLQQFDANSSTQFLFAYEIPYKREKEILIDLPLPVKAAVFMLPTNSVQLESAMLNFDGNRTVQGMDIQTYSSNNLVDQNEIVIKLTGKIKIASQKEDNSLISILIGASVFVIAVLLAFIWLRKRNKKLDIVENNEQEDDLEALLDAVIALDDANKNGEIPEIAYQSRRNELIQRIKTIQGK